MRDKIIKLAREHADLRRHLIPLLRQASRMDVRVIQQGRRMYLRGNTYSIKNDLRSLGAKWDRDEEAWWFSTTKWKQVGDQVEALLAPVKGMESLDEALTPTIQLKSRDNRVYLLGKTYDYRTILKRYGFRWDSQVKGWWVDSRGWAKAGPYIRRALGTPATPSAPPKRPGGATDRQIQYAMNLLHRMGEWGWHDSDYGQGMDMPTRSDLERWKGRDVGDLIRSLKEDLR